MRSPAILFAWQFWRRHRWGLLAIVSWVAVQALVIHAVPAGGTARLVVCSTAIVPALVALMYLIVVFCHGEAADVMSGESGFPRWMLTLPVSTGTLVRWPMLYGAATVSVLWWALALLVWRPSGLEVPLWAPAVGIAAFLAWGQAVVWYPFGLSGLRIAPTSIGLILIVAGNIFFEMFPVGEAALTVLLAAALLGAFVVAHVGVAQARRGDVPDWRWVHRLIEALVNLLPRRRRAFPSAVAAQRWLEWRLHGWGLTIGVAAIVPTVLLLFQLSRQVQVDAAKSESVPVLPGLSPEASVTLTTLAEVLMLPLLLSVGGSPTGAPRGSPYPLTSFLATRPLSSAALVAVRLQVTALSTLTAWSLLLGGVAMWLLATGEYAALVELRRSWLADYSNAQVVVLSVLIVVALITLTWMGRVKSTFLDLTGRRWLSFGVVFSGMGATVGLVWLGYWFYHHPQWLGVVGLLLPWLAGMAVVVKLLTAAWAWRAVRRRGLLSLRALSGIVGGWLAAVLVLFALLEWLLPAGAVPWYLLGCSLMLALVLTRLLAAPLALAWNRHR
jgi:hypothetical protein